jgi:hypothetical protein
MTDQLDSIEARAEKATSVDELAHAKHMADHYRMLLNVTNKAWLRAAQAALAGDLSDIRNRVELAGQPVEFIEQTVDQSSRVRALEGEIERLRAEHADLLRKAT